MTTLSARLRALALVLVGALAFAIAPATAAHAEGPGSVTVTVTGDDSPVLFTFVYLDGPDFAVGYTEDSGQVAFTDLALGDYTLQVSATPEYQEASIELSLTAEVPHADLVVALTPWPTGSGTISGTVVDLASGDPISDVTVHAVRLNEPGPNLETITDVAGAFTFTNLVDGVHEVAVWFAPGYFGRSATVEIIEGESATVDLALLAADSTITGRVVDPEGNGVANVSVSASLDDPNLDAGTGAETDADGYYTLDSVGAGRWELSTTTDAEWDRAVITVEVEAASTTTAPDIVLTRRTTGMLTGLVASSDGIPESQIGGFFDVCATALHPDGTPVPGATMITGGDSFYYFSLLPGEYTVFFEDCDADREPHGYQSAYLDGSTTLAGATIVTVETGVNLFLERTYLEPQASFPAPDHDATPVKKRDLEPADEDLIQAPETARRGETIEVVVGTEYAGQWVSAWLYPRPTQLGEWHQVSAEGTIEITVPQHHPIGARDLVVQNADDEVIGWTDLQVQHRSR
jgi:hypothetical protein